MESNSPNGDGISAIMKRSTDCNYTRLEEGDSETTLSTTTRLPAHIQEPSPITTEVDTPATLAGESIEAKNGTWKYGICSCFQQGIFHRDFWNAWLCPQVLLAQILQRNDLLWLAKPENFNGQKNQDSSRLSFVLRWTFRLLFCLVTVAELYAVHLLQQLQDDTEDVSAVTIRVFWSQELICFALSLPMSIWMLLVVVRLRRRIRERHNIPPATLSVPGCKSDPLCNLTLGKSEDLACAICCSCCMLRQMASQTNDKEETESSSQEPPTKDQPIEETQTDDSKKGFRWWWFQKRTPKTLEESALNSPLVERPPSSSQSLNSSQLRHRLSSSPVSSPAEKC